MMLVAVADDVGKAPCVCHELQPAAQGGVAAAKTSSPFLQQVLLSVTVAVVTTFVLERVLGRSK